MSIRHNIIRIRRGTASEWMNSEPQPGGEVLKLGEPGYEKDTGRLKIGDGSTPWNNLPYFNAGTPINPEELQDLLGGGFISAGNNININYDDNGNVLTISATGLQPSGNYSVIGHNHVSNDITDFNSAVSGLLPPTYYTAIEWSPYHSYISGDNNSRYLAGDIVYQSGNLYKALFDNESLPVTNAAYWELVGAGYRLNIDGRDIERIPYPVTSVNGQTGNITINVPVQDIIAGTDITVSNNSGIYTVSSSNTIYNDTLEPDGFVNRTTSVISFNNSSREFSIGPKSPATSYILYNNGIKVIKNTTETITLPNSTALYFIHFDKSNNNLSYKTTGFDFDTDIPIALVYYNADDAKAVFFGEERHGIRMDSATHRYLHNVFGTQYINGLSISNYTTSGNGSNNSDATIAIGDGLIYDEDIEASISHSDSPVNPFEQVLYPTAQIPVYYKVGASGVWTNTTPTDYPVKTGATIEYNLDSAGTWSASYSPNPTSDRYIAYWICATTQENAPIISIMGQRVDSSLIQAQSNNAWGNLNLTGLPIVELRPLYRLIYDTKVSLANDPKGFLVDILDIRSHIDTVTGLTQNDHGNLYGLADDDHYQYVHIDNARTISAVHTFNNGLNASGLINATSGNFTSLTVNNTGVSLEGHTHIASNITDFNSSVSGVINTSLSTDIIAGTGIAVTYDNINDDLIISSDGLFSVVNLGTLTGTNSIKGGINNSIQTLTLNGTATTFTKGTGWPTASSTSTDTVLRITVTTATTITWTIVTDWFNQPPTGALSVGTHLFLLRGIGSSIVEGHYIGNKTN